MTTKIKKIVIIGLLLTILSVMALPASAANIYASGTMTIQDNTKTHYALIYNIPFSSFQYYAVGGYKVLLLPLLYPHTNPQDWNRLSYDSGRKSLLLIPERYTQLRPSYAREIYVYGTGGGGGSW